VKQQRIILALLGMSIVACAVFGYMAATSPSLMHYPGKAWQSADGAVWLLWGALFSAFAYARAGRLLKVGVPGRRTHVYITVARLFGGLACLVSLLILIPDVLVGDWTNVGPASVSLCFFGIAGFLLLAEVENGRPTWGWVWFVAQLLGVPAVFAIVWGVPDLLGIPLSQSYRAAVLPFLIVLPLIVPFVAFNVHRFWTPSGRWAGCASSAQTVVQPPAKLAQSTDNSRQGAPASAGSV